MTPARAAPLHALLALNPGIISNNRLGGDFAGDTETPEQHIPATGFKGRDWEVCMTMNDTWGFISDDHNWKSTKDIIHKLCDIVSKGGNYLLNVGPDANGVIPAASVQRLKEVGAWMKVNGEAIYGTTASPFPNLSWGRCTRKSMRNGPWGLFGKTTRLYLHVFDWPSDGKLLVPDLTNKPVAARLLADGTSLTFAASKEGIRIEIPAQAPDAIASVVVLDVVGDVATLPYVVKAADDGKVELRPDAARLSGQLRAHGFIHVNFERWTNPKDYAEWTVDIPKAGKYRLETQAGAVKAANVMLVAGSRRWEIPVAATGEVTRYKPIKAGPVELAAGRQNIRLEAAPADWSPVNMRTLALIPED
jgi:alpha-L-fucosidase